MIPEAFFSLWMYGEILEWRIFFVDFFSEHYENVFLLELIHTEEQCDHVQVSFVDVGGIVEDDDTGELPLDIPIKTTLLIINQLIQLRELNLFLNLHQIDPKCFYQ